MGSASQPMRLTGTRHCVARHLDAARNQVRPRRMRSKGAPVQAPRASARGTIKRLDAIAGVGAPMPPVPWGATRGQWSERIERMERRVRASAREGLGVHRAAARLARLARHNNVAGLARAHPDHWVRNPYLWQLVEAGALTGKDRDEAARELCAQPRIAPSGALIATEKRNVRASGPDATDVARVLGVLLEDRTLEEHIAQGLGQALVAPANERWPEGWKIPTGRLRYWIGLVRVRERRAPLRVAAAAIGDERSVVVSLPPPARHFDVMAAAARDHSDEEIRQWGQRGQGFVDQHGRWLSRAAAEEVAKACGQLRGQTIGGRSRPKTCGESWPGARKARGPQQARGAMGRGAGARRGHQVSGRGENPNARS